MISFKTLVELIHKNDLQNLKSFLENRHCNIDDADEEQGLTALMVAASEGKLDFVYLLLSHGANVNAQDNDSATALHHAAKNGHSDVCLELLEANAQIEANDSGGWTPFIWACYKGHVATVDCLVSRGADINARGVYNLTGLVWASGKGYYDIVELLLDNSAKVESGDKYGTTSLIWAARGGHVDICNLLLKAGANVDAVGMYSWTPLLVATRANKYEIVDQILSKGPNVNTVDKDGMTALSVACKEGYTEIALKLLSSGAYTNLQDKAGDTNLIHAAKGGHKAIVEALLKKYADVDIRGKEGKTCLHWAIDKNHVHIVKILLTANPDLEIKTNEGDTALLRAVRQRSPEIVELLLDKKAKINAINSKNDTALHIAMRARSKAVVEVLLRHPKHSQLLYKPNNKGETPYNLDMGSAKPILGQMFGTRRLNANEDGEVMLGYDLYSSALANILTEPSLAMPITCGLYAKWGSGKSFLLGKLRDEMKTFTREWIVEPAFENSPLVFMVILHVAVIFALIAWILSYLTMGLGASSVIVGLATGALVIVATYVTFIGLIKFGQHGYASFQDLKSFLGEKFNSLKLVIQVVFSHPPGPDWVGSSSSNKPFGVGNVYPLRLLFTEQTKVITSAGGQNSVTQMIGSLYDAIEEHYGVFSTRLYRAFRPKPVKPTSREKWRKVCCLPYALMYVIVMFMLIFAIVLTVISFEHILDDDDHEFAATTTAATPKANDTSSYYDRYQPKFVVDESNQLHLTMLEEKVLKFVLIAIAVVIGAFLLANIQTFLRCIKSLIFSQRKHLQSTVAKLDLVKSEGYLQAVKNEVQLMVNMVKTLDAFTGHQTRLVVVVDGLDSCEQSKVLSVLDAVHMLFSDEGSPFIILLAIDPHVITKAIELNIHQTFRDTSIGGLAYLRNIVHLPFYLQNSGLRKVAVAQQLSGSTSHHHRTKSSAWIEHDDRKLSVESVMTSLTNRKGKGGASALSRRESINDYGTRSSGRGRKGSFGSVSSIGSRFNHQSGGIQNQADITRVVATDDYMSDVNVKSMRRLMNVVYVMSRLMRAFHIDFNWYHLATWVNITETWPYRISWIIFYVETASENQYTIEDSMSLWEIYAKIRSSLPSHRDLEPLLDMDRDEKKLEAILALKKRTLTVKELKIFLPFSINLDPYIKKVIRDEYVSLAALEGSETGFGWFGEHEQPQQKMSNLVQQVAPRSVARKVTREGVNAPEAMKQYYPDLYPPSQLVPKPLVPASPEMRTVSPVLLPDEITEKALSKKSVEEVCDLIRQIDGLMAARIDTYCDAIVSQNISGAVLAHCSIQELKSVLNMNFGDWEIFQMVLVSLRGLEKRRKHSLMVVKTRPPPKSEAVIVSSSCHSNPVHVASSASSMRTTPSRKVSVSAAETAISMEDALISGLLSTLNEDAHEDILTDGLMHGRRHRDASGSYEQDCEESDVIYLSRARSKGAIMSQSMGSEDAFNALERGGGAASGKGSATDLFASIGGSPTGSLADVSNLVAFESQTTSPTKAPVTNTTSIHAGRPKSSTGSKTRHMRDRLDSLTHSLYVRERRRESRPKDEEDEPYAWISQTAPASPTLARSRAGSIMVDDFEKIKESSVTPAISVERLGDKVRRKIKSALSRMEQPNALPPVHRPREASVATAEEVRSSRFTSKLRSLSRSQEGAGTKSMTASIELPIFGDFDEPDTDLALEEKYDNSSSPEQETVLPRMDSSRPHIQSLFMKTTDE